MGEKARIALIDDDEPILDSLQHYLQRRGFTVSGFRSARAFLDVLDKGSNFQCVVTDVRMPRMTGLELQRELTQRSRHLPLIIITGHGDIDMAVSAIKAGAFDFIEKPVDEQRLAASIGDAIESNRDAIADGQQIAELARRFAGLSGRQRQVVDLAVQGMSNEEIGLQLGISPRTVEHYRESAMERMQATRFAQLIQMAVRVKAHNSTRMAQP